MNKITDKENEKFSAINHYSDIVYPDEIMEFILTLTYQIHEDTSITKEDANILREYIKLAKGDDFEKAKKNYKMFMQKLNKKEKNNE